MQTWQEAQIWERDWHGDCVNSFNEEMKQLVYAQRMGLRYFPTNKTPYSFDLQNKTILDIGGGAYSLLLKCENFKNALVIDPVTYPDWVYARYKAHNIDSLIEPGETFLSAVHVICDEAWIYNCLQHTQDPKKIIENARKMAKLIRIFEWIDQPISTGHIQTFSQKDLDKWLGGEGKSENINQSSCVGTCYYGVFPA